jgi:hypothetical protein
MHGKQGEHLTHVIGLRHAWEGEEPFGLSDSDRRQHVYVVGKTGTGKTTLLRNLILQDINRGGGVGVILHKGKARVRNPFSYEPPTRLIRIPDRTAPRFTSAPLET